MFDIKRAIAKSHAMAKTAEKRHVRKSALLHRILRNQVLIMCEQFGVTFEEINDLCYEHNGFWSVKPNDSHTLPEQERNRSS